MTESPAAVIGLSAPERKPARLHLNYLDGIRGLAAFYVLCNHTVAAAIGQTPENQIPLWLHYMALWAGFGHLSVAVFIVLSGYCLMLPVARTACGELRGGFRDYIYRRARRIVPPYFAAFAFSLLLIGLLARQPHPPSIVFDLPIFTPGVLLSHLLLLHNLNEPWSLAVNPPMWSVAAEWQIYFIFPALLLPVWRKFGNAAALAAAFAVGLAPHFLLRHTHYTLDWTAPWYVGLFGLGMVGAAVTTANAGRHELTKRWVVIFAAFSLILFAICSLKHDAAMHYVLPMDILAGFFAISAIVYFYFASEGRLANVHSSGLLRLLESRPSALLGSFSYSLYLIHVPLVMTISGIVYRLGLPTQTGAAVILAGIPISLLCAYLFHLVFEKPFMSKSAARAPRRE